MNTKSVCKVPVSQAIVNKINQLLLTNLVQDLQKRYGSYELTLRNIAKDEKLYTIDDERYYYIPADGLIIPNVKKTALEATKFVQLPELNWKSMTKAVAQKWFLQLARLNYMISVREEGIFFSSDKGVVSYLCTDGTKREAHYVYCVDVEECMEIGNKSETQYKSRDWGVAYADTVCIPIYELTSSDKSEGLGFFVKHKLNFFGTDKAFGAFIELYQNKLLQFTDRGVEFQIKDAASYRQAWKICKDFVPKRRPELLDEFIKSICLKDILNNDGDYETVCNAIKGELLKCDNERSCIIPYDEYVLTNQDSGHWELWEGGNDTRMSVGLAQELVARNPVDDALSNLNGMVGIDFGTKSTVAAYRRGRRPGVHLMKIGDGHFDSIPGQNSYENPTVLELCGDLCKFQAAYKKHKGRPYTRWADLQVSHAADGRLKNSGTSWDSFPSFFYELKQWASDEFREVNLRDHKGYNCKLKPYPDLSDDDFDPIEVYAYYLGLYINNMRDKAIYLRYRLSFPVKMKKEVRQKLVRSFAKGIKKSLPVQVLNDDKCMKSFRVEVGCSEPAAYAITALRQYELKPKEEQKIWYGVFDFGGGTTDFDFGVWMREKDDTERYDYRISHFSSDGDPHLGGENLLAVLAYNVFLDNYQELLKSKIVFIRPSWEEPMGGAEYLIRQDSSPAHFNHKWLMEKLRCVWERSSEKGFARKALEDDGSLALRLLDVDGKPYENYRLKVDVNKLDKCLESRVEKVVNQFLSALQNCVSRKTNLDRMGEAEDIHIFFAGNSSKSLLVYRAFQKGIADWANRDGAVQKERFKVYPPLGTAISQAVQKGDIRPCIDDLVSYCENEGKECGKSKPEEANKVENRGVNWNFDRPTGKTGVAWGLLENRVRVENNEPQALYYVGRNKGDNFYCVLDKNDESSKDWQRFCRATGEFVDIYFTKLPQAAFGNLDIYEQGVFCESLWDLKVDPNRQVYVRFASPSRVEYVVASESEIRNNSYDDKAVSFLDLEEPQ